MERQVTKSATATLTYIHSRGVHQLVTINANAPLDPTDPNSRPIPGAGNIYQFTSEADFKQNQLMAHLNVRAGQKLELSLACTGGGPCDASFTFSGYERP